MKSRKTQIHSKVHRILPIRFEEQELTSYSGLIVFQAMFARLRIKARLQACVAHLSDSSVYGRHVVLLLLLVHLILGGRRLREIDYLRDDPMLLRVTGLRRLPDVSTVSRTLKETDGQSVDGLRALNRELVTNDLLQAGLTRHTLDFDGSVQSTTGRAEGSAVGYNPKKKGARSYYPLFCTLAQTGQFFDVHHRPGNVHDSKDALIFMGQCFKHFEETFPGKVIESRMDAAFFDRHIIALMNVFQVSFSASVPFARLPELKGMIESRRRWQRIDSEWSFFDQSWKPKSWDHSQRFLFFRRRVKTQTKGPIQLDLFEPKNFAYEYKVVVTNKWESAKSVLAFHNGRGAQEAVFGEAKTCSGLDVVCGKRLHANQVFTVTAMLAHNLGRSLQMAAKPKVRQTDPKRRALWNFQTLETLRQRFVQRAGRLIRPQGKLTLSMSANRTVEDDIRRYLDALQNAA